MGGKLFMLFLAAASAFGAHAQAPVGADSMKLEDRAGAGTVRPVSLMAFYTDAGTAGAADKVTQERMNKGLVNNSLEALSGQVAGHQFLGNAWLYLYKVVTLCNRSLDILETNKVLAGTNYGPIAPKAMLACNFPTAFLSF